MANNPPPLPLKLSTKVELSVSAQNLLDLDILSKSDPVCILYIKVPTVQTYHEIGRTELLKNTLNPEWVKKFEVEYCFEERQLLRFNVYDWDTKSSNPEEQDDIGYMECTLAEIMSCQGSQFKKSLSKGGTLIITAEEVSSNKEVAVLKCGGSGLDKKDFFGKSDPYLVFGRTTESSNTIPVHRTEVIKNSLNPSWKQFSIPVKFLCVGDGDRMIKIECFDWDSDGSHDLIGECFTTLNSLRDKQLIHLDLINPKKKAKKKNYKTSGKIEINLISIYIQPTFLDYIKGGLQLHFTLAVDFTASNGDPKQPRSLHYYQPGVDNQYSLALKGVGEVIQDYDSDKLFPALGFGARVPPDWQVKFDFYLNGSNESPYCNGVEGILAAYENSLRTVQLYGPTNFSPVIRHVMGFANQFTDGKNYFILLIITDGIITDLQNTKKCLVEASRLPMSVIIVGVGIEDFSAMESLDGDNERLSYNGQFADRDIVQFVEMRKYLSGPNGHDLIKHQLAKEVLAEIPGQVVTWMKWNRIDAGNT